MVQQVQSLRSVQPQELPERGMAARRRGGRKAASGAMPQVRGPQAFGCAVSFLVLLGRHVSGTNCHDFRSTIWQCPICHQPPKIRLPKK